MKSITKLAQAMNCKIAPASILRQRKTAIIDEATTEETNAAAILCERQPSPRRSGYFRDAITWRNLEGGECEFVVKSGVPFKDFFRFGKFQVYKTHSFNLNRSERGYITVSCVDDFSYKVNIHTGEYIFRIDDVTPRFSSKSKRGKITYIPKLMSLLDMNVKQYNDYMLRNKWRTVLVDNLEEYDGINCGNVIIKG